MGAPKDFLGICVVVIGIMIYFSILVSPVVFMWIKAEEQRKAVWIIPMVVYFIFAVAGTVFLLQKIEG